MGDRRSRRGTGIYRLMSGKPASTTCVTTLGAGWMDKGTLVRTRTCQPGVVLSAKTSPVNSVFPPTTDIQKIRQAIARSLPLMAPDLRAQFLSLVNIHVLIVMGVLYAGSHVVVIGEIIDGAGILLLGFEALHLMRELSQFIRMAVAANNDSELDAAARCFADLVARSSADIVILFGSVRILSSVRRLGVYVRETASFPEVEAAVTRIKALVSDPDGVLARLAFEADDERKAQKLASFLDNLNSKISTFKGKPILRIVKEPENWLRSSDNFLTEEEELLPAAKKLELKSRGSYGGKYEGRKGYDDGGFLSKTDSREGNAVLHSWKNKMDIVEEQIVPKNSIVLEGPAAPQASTGPMDPAMPGGDIQIYHGGQISPEGVIEPPAKRQVTGKVYTVAPDGSKIRPQ